MHYSGLLVTVTPGRFHECVRELEELSGVEVFHRDPERGRIVAVQETSTQKAQETGFSRIGSLPQVLAVELVYHYRDTAPPAEDVVAGEDGRPGNPQGKDARP